MPGTRSGSIYRRGQRDGAWMVPLPVTPSSPSSGFASRTAMRKAPPVHTTPTPHVAVRRRRALLTAVVASVIASLALVPSAAQAEQPVSAQYAAGSLQRYLTAHDHHFHTVFQGTEFADYGLTLDGVIAMDAAGV